jgi:mannosyl-glycoprotein endo-beta-N-acetylglucosaminidase
LDSKFYWHFAGLGDDNSTSADGDSCLSWDEQKRYAKVSAHEAGERAYDVYMGVDVFGRHTYGGGGFQSDVALKAAQEAGVSSALFAPGWVYETKQPPDFKTAQNRWWGTIGQCWPIARLNPTILPFFSDFNQVC